MGDENVDNSGDDGRKRFSEAQKEPKIVVNLYSMPVGVMCGKIGGRAPPVACLDSMPVVMKWADRISATKPIRVSLLIEANSESLLASVSCLESLNSLGGKRG